MNSHFFTIGALFWIAFTAAAYFLSLKATSIRCGQIKIPKFTALYAASAAVAIAVEISGGDYRAYKEGGNVISALLYPATVALAIPLYKTRKEIVARLGEVAAATIISTIVSVGTIYFLGVWMGMNLPLVKSLLPKCVTTPVAIEISKMIDAWPEMAVCAVCYTGICGIIFGHALLRLCGVKDNISIGLAIGSASHVIGTAKCLENSREQGGASALVLITVALFSAFFIAVIF